MTIPAHHRVLSLTPAGLVLALVCLMVAGLVEAAPKDKERWDRKYNSDTYLFGTRPIAFLERHVGLLPKGKALDIAMGEGRNGVFLATKGFEVVGLDISERGLGKARKLAEERGVRITTRVVDLETHQLEQNAYDVVLCAYYLQRDLFPQIKAALKSGGVVLVETYTVDHQKYRPRFRKEYLIHTNELLEIFKDFKILRYQNVDDGKAAYASILAQKP